MQYSIIFSKNFKKSLKRYRDEERILNGFRLVMLLLKEGRRLPPEYKDHKLRGQYDSFRECHIFPDVLLIYRKFKNTKEILLDDIGSHSELF